MAFDKHEFDVQYIRANIIQKKVVFNRKIKEDMEMLEYINRNIGNFNVYVKNMIRKQMENE